MCREKPLYTKDMDGGLVFLIYLPRASLFLIRF